MADLLVVSGSNLMKLAQAVLKIFATTHFVTPAAAAKSGLGTDGNFPLESFPLNSSSKKLSYGLYSHFCSSVSRLIVHGQR